MGAAAAATVAGACWTTGSQITRNRKSAKNDKKKKIEKIEQPGDFWSHDTAAAQ